MKEIKIINTEKPLKRFTKMKSLFLYIPLLVISNKIFNKFNVFDIEYWSDYSLKKGSHKIEIILTEGLLFMGIFILIHWVLPPFMTLIEIKNDGTEKVNNILLKTTGEEVNSKINHEIKIETIREILYWATCIILISLCIGLITSLILITLTLIITIYSIGIMNYNFNYTPRENDNC
jgi:hypothetical protein